MKYLYIILFSTIFNTNFSMDLDAILNEALQDFSNSENKKILKKDESKFIKKLKTDIAPLYDEIIGYVELCRLNPHGHIAFPVEKSLAALHNSNKRSLKIKNSNDKWQINILKDFITKKNNILIEMGIKYQNIHTYIQSINDCFKPQNKLLLNKMLNKKNFPKNIDYQFPEAILQDFVSRDHIITGLIDELYEKIEYIQDLCISTLKDLIGSR